MFGSRDDCDEDDVATSLSCRYCCPQPLQTLSAAVLRVGGATCGGDYENCNLSINDDEAGGDCLIAEAVDKVIINLSWF